LLHDTRERDWRRRLPQLAELRYTQATAALTQAVALDPSLAPAHRSLADLYREMRYFDLELNHLRAYRALDPAAGPEHEERESRLAELVADLESKLAAESARVKVLDRAMLAAQLGLAGKALELLLESDLAAFGRQGMALELELLLRTGRARDAREWTGPDLRSALGAPYHWIRAQALAASGDYALAEEALTLVAVDTAAAEAMPARERMARLIGQAILAEQPGPESVPHRLSRALVRRTFRTHVAGLARDLRKEADATVLRGLLALEEGEVDLAEEAFRTALAFWEDGAAAASGRGLDFDTRLIAEACLDWLE